MKNFKPSRPDSENRNNNRVDFRINQNIRTEIQIYNQKIIGNVLDLSVNGACVAIDKDILGTIAESSSFEATFIFPSGEKFTTKSIYCWSGDFKDEKVKVGLKFVLEEQVTNEESLVALPHSFPVTGYLYKDHFFYEKSIFSLLAINKTTAKILLYDSEFILYQGMEADLIFSLHTSNSKGLKCVVKNVTIVDKTKYIVYLKVQNWNSSLESDFVNHLIQNHNLSLEKIRSAGFKVKDISNNFRFRFVKTHDEYMEVLKLRYQAYLNAGKVQSGKKPEDMAAPLDYISRILYATHGDKVVASVAISFPENNDILLDTERGLGHKLPDWMPAPEESVEISRLCTDIEYRRGDLLVRMFEHIYRVFASSGRRYIITSTDDKLWPIYKGLGFTKSKLIYDHPYLRGIPHEIITIGVEKGLIAKGISVTRWNYLYREMTFFMLKNGEIELSRIQKLKINVLSIIGFILKIRLPKKY